MKFFTPTSTERTAPHRAVEKILDEMKVSYFSEYQFEPYKVDIYLTEWHLAVEIDGPQHSPNKDAVRDQYLLIHYGLPILRIKAKGMRKGAVEASVLAFLDEHADTANERKHLWLTTR